MIVTLNLFQGLYSIFKDGRTIWSDYTLNGFFYHPELVSGFFWVIEREKQKLKSFSTTESLNLNGKAWEIAISYQVFFIIDGVITLIMQQYNAIRNIQDRFVVMIGNNKASISF